MNAEKIKEIFSDEAFVESLFALETPEQKQAALKEKGIELTEEEKRAIRELLGKVESGELTPEQLELWQKQAEDGELSEEMLEQVSGGLGMLGMLGVMAAMAGGMAVTNGIRKHGFTGFFKRLASCFF